MSLIFVVGTLVQFAIVLLIRRISNQGHRSNVDNNQIPTEKLNSGTTKVWPIQEVFVLNPNMNKEKSNFIKGTKMNLLLSSSLDEKIDFASLMIFPIAYSIYNYVYWKSYLE